MKQTRRRADEGLRLFVDGGVQLSEELEKVEEKLKATVVVVEKKVVMWC